MKTVFLFSGQGSQYRRMGEALYRASPAFARSLDKSDEIVTRLIGRSLINELYHEDKELFDDLIITHPAIVAVEIAMIDLMKGEGIEPDYVSGNSLGEFAAAVAAGIWSHETALEASIEQAISIVDGDVQAGGMLAVMTEEEEKLIDYLDEYNLYLASKNFPGHYTVSGTVEDLGALQRKLEKEKVHFVRLPVKYPFHCGLIDTGDTMFDHYARFTSELSRPSTNFVSGLYAQSADRVPIDYFSFVSFMEEVGPLLYLDLGPSGTSATFVKYNLSSTSKSKTHTIMTPYHKEVFQLASLKKILKATG